MQLQLHLFFHEDALLNYARLSYEIGNAYKNPSLLLASFVDQYPMNKA